ncbi:restriction endonuclease subunit S [Actinocrispum wychmicini]|uniref:restriction endonuclease subunit S n=1 Tax=Actinocrispum wychmicini TaxID=1213861 RepID=UPI001052CC92|nr:restriction endonuclease subunit S [Actinocrispum wychmicini]
MDSLIGEVPDVWAECRLDEVCDILAGPSTALANVKERGSTDVPVVMPRDLRNNRIADDCAAGVTQEAARELSRYHLQTNDIVCSRTGHLGRQALVGANQRGWLIGSACLRLRVRRMVNAPYLVYYLGHPAVQGWIIRNTSGAVIPSLSTKMLGSLPVVVPPAVVQTGTADILGALDEKIIVHEQISRTTAALRDAVLVQLLAGGKSGQFD